MTLLTIRQRQQPNRPKYPAFAEVVILNEHEAKTAITELRGRTPYPSAMLALFVGLRRGELLALRWHHLHIDSQLEKMVQINEALEETKAGISFKKPKTKNSIRGLGLPDIVIETRAASAATGAEGRLGSWEAAGGRARFPQAGRDTAVAALFLEGVDGPCDLAASVKPPVTFHALRHTHASDLIDAKARPSGDGEVSARQRTAASIAH